MLGLHLTDVNMPRRLMMDSLFGLISRIQILMDGARAIPETVREQVICLRNLSILIFVLEQWYKNSSGCASSVHPYG